MAAETVILRFPLYLFLHGEPSRRAIKDWLEIEVAGPETTGGGRLRNQGRAWRFACCAPMLMG